MERLSSPHDMQQWANDQRRSGRTVAFVPTMGFFHPGHLQLMEYGRSRADRLVVSLFVNPLQFGPGEDFERYPRDEERDLALARGAGADVLFSPSPEDLYPVHFQTHVTVEKVSRGLCGASRPGHFRGVATVVLKLFHLVQPHWAIFGLKDYQQYVVIRRMVEDLNLDLEVVGRPTVREPDGLAMSSRNVYLSPEERRSALALSASLKAARERCRSGERRAAVLLEDVVRRISGEARARLDYARIVDPETLDDTDLIRDKAVLILAAWVGKTRLIDNGFLEGNPDCPA
ncbi:MAG: pantoate--beta-alanine ligase [Desulfobacterota bacterium]|nr:pantoate--beta-alanine ligase [Thermodesulfobacteriota bacterium]